MAGIAQSLHAWLKNLAQLLRISVLAAAMLVAVQALQGCASATPLTENQEQTTYKQNTVELKNVPLFKQEQWFCGPAALSMALAQKGVKYTPEELADWVYTPEKQGSLQIEMQAAPRRAGLLSYPLEPRIQSIFDALNENHAVVVLLNLALPIAPQWHYAVVVGYNAEQNTMVLHSGRAERENIPLKTFERLWERSKNWGFVVLQPDAPPPRFVSAQAYLNAAVALEQQNPKNALLAYQKGSDAWPTEPWFLFAAGNLHFAQMRHLEAEQAFKAAVTLNANFADGWNNLAETLNQLDKKSEARVAINKAISLGGPRLANYEATAKKINPSK
jgi:tetratricopeptide (TPR) repeat protein